MSRTELRLSGWFGALCLALAAFVYLDNTGSVHTAGNPDEFHYLQIARLTAGTGHWLPLQAASVRGRNTKPPGLFWQGMASTGLGKHWELSRLRLPNALFSVATAAMAFLIARRLAGTFSAGAIAALSYLAFLGVYRHGRVFLTSAPETFWLFLPFFILLMRPSARIGWGASLAFGLMLGTGLLYKSFAMIIPSAGALAWWTLHLRGYKSGDWLRGDAPKIALTAIVALGVFGLWFVLDPQRQFILQDFILKENVGKFDTSVADYFAKALWGKHSIWQYTAGWLTNAGLVAPAVIAVFILAWRGRRETSAGEQLLWIWIITLFVFHLLPDLRYERYLLPAMPAVAVLCGLHWERIPRWVQCITLAASGLLGLALLAGALLLARHLPGPGVYSPADWLLFAVILAFAAAGLWKKEWTRAFALPSVLFVYLGLTIFLRPFDGPAGAFAPGAIDAARGRTVILTSVFTARDEIYRFLLPGADVRRIKEKALPSALDDKGNGMFILSTSLDAPAEMPGFRAIGRRLDLREHFTGEQTADMLRGNIAKHLFAWDVLFEREGSTPH
ncbi:MAG: glycosyltransferase family 39 protein [Chthoniobacterales bacterium]|nr:glycosyltransferase family 39 protein [Chthoniobacterales bacterium]